MLISPPQSGLGNLIKHVTKFPLCRFRKQSLHKWSCTGDEGFSPSSSGTLRAGLYREETVYVNQVDKRIKENGEENKKKNRKKVVFWACSDMSIIIFLLPRGHMPAPCMAFCESFCSWAEVFPLLTCVVPSQRMMNRFSPVLHCIVSPARQINLIIVPTFKAENVSSSESSSLSDGTPRPSSLSLTLFLRTGGNAYFKHTAYASESPNKHQHTHAILHSFFAI